MEYNQTLDYAYESKEFDIDGNNYEFLFIDCSANFEYFDIIKFSEKTKGIMYVYDITEEKTLEHITSFLNSDDLRDLNKVPKILVGNKCDLGDKRKIETEKGEKLAINKYMKNNPEKPKTDPVEKLENPKPEPTEIKESDKLRMEVNKKRSGCCGCLS